MQRQSGGTNDNPTIIKFAKNSDTLRLIGICGSMIHRETVAKAIALNSLFKTLKSYRYGSDNERPHSKMYMHVLLWNKLF